MTGQTCVFCKIINKDVSSSIIKETDTVLVVKDLYPKAPVHYLIIPKKHRENLLDFVDEDASLAWDIFKMARDLGNELEGAKAFNLISNNGAAAGQSVFHAHWHFLAGKNLYQAGFSL